LLQTLQTLRISQTLTTTGLALSQTHKLLNVPVNTERTTC